MAWTEWQNIGGTGKVVFAYCKGCPIIFGNAFTAVHTNNNANAQFTLTSKVSGSYKMRLYMSTSTPQSYDYSIKLRDEVIFSTNWLNAPYEMDFELDLSEGDTIIFSAVARDVNIYGIIINEV